MASRPFPLLVTVVVATACTSDPPEDTAIPGADLRLVTANVGNLDQATGGPCPADPYHGALCSIDQEELIRASLDGLAPDIVVLLEVLDADLCPEWSWNGAPGLTCTGAPNRVPYQQTRRLVGDDFTILCDGIAHFDCVALRAERLHTPLCADGALCMGGLETPPHPEACAGIGGFTSVSRTPVTSPVGDFNLVVAHPLNAEVTKDPCRLAQYEQALDTLLDDDLPDLVAGDMNNDPYRVPETFASSVYWHQRVGPGLALQAVSVDDDPPLPTWVDLLTLDYVLSDSATGDCQVLGVTEGTDRLDGALQTMDHRAVVCDLSL